MYICSACKLLVTEPITVTQHFAECTVVCFDDEGSRSPFIGTMDVKVGTRIYECAVCDWFFTLKYFMQLHLTEKHNITLNYCLIVVLPMEFIAMSALIEEMK